MPKKYSFSTHLAVFAAGGVLAMLGIALYTTLSGSDAPTERPSARASASQRPLAGGQSMTGPSMSNQPPGSRKRSSEVASGDTARIASASLPTMTVYKSPTCGCCTKWVEHIEAAGFTVQTQDLADVTSRKDALGVPQRLRSCHTAKVGEYVIEGHVPAADVKHLLSEAPEVRGVAVPGMPVGSPGMEVPGRPAQPYRVIAFSAEEAASIFARH